MALKKDSKQNWEMVRLFVGVSEEKLTTEVNGKKRMICASCLIEDRPNNLIGTKQMFQLEHRSQSDNVIKLKALIAYLKGQVNDSDAPCIIFYPNSSYLYEEYTEWKEDGVVKDSPHTGLWNTISELLQTINNGRDNPITIEFRSKDTFLVSANHLAQEKANDYLCEIL